MRFCCARKLSRVQSQKLPTRYNFAMPENALPCRLVPSNSRDHRHCCKDLLPIKILFHRWNVPPRFQARSALRSLVSPSATMVLLWRKKNANFLPCCGLGGNGCTIQLKRECDHHLHNSVAPTLVPVPTALELGLLAPGRIVTIFVCETLSTMAVPSFIIRQLGLTCVLRPLHLGLPMMRARRDKTRISNVVSKTGGGKANLVGQSVL